MNHAAVALTLCLAIVPSTAAQDLRTRPRVRSHSTAIVQAVAHGHERSATFRLLVDTIDGMDGLVYVDEGECGHAVRGCLVPTVAIAGPNRVLRILVTLRKAPGCEAVEVIGHELQHAIEVLSHPRVKTDRQVYNLFDIVGRTSAGRFETEAAVRAGLAIGREGCGDR